MGTAKEAHAFIPSGHHHVFSPPSSLDCMAARHHMDGLVWSKITHGGHCEEFGLSAILKPASGSRQMDTMEVAGWVQKIIREDKPVKVNIDVGGLGVGIYDRLREQGVNRSILNAVNFGGKPNEPPPLDELGNPAGGPANRRAELWQNMKNALEEGRFELPDSDSLQADLVSPAYKYDSAGRLLLESKQDMRKRGVPSPDEADAVALCFSEPGGVGYVRNANFSRDLKETYANSYQ